MSKDRKRRKRKGGQSPSRLPLSWVDSDGFHALVAGGAPSPEALEEAGRRYQASIRKSPLWDEMVREFGGEQAERMLLEFRVELRR
jgi:hypothetical protein